MRLRALLIAAVLASSTAVSAHTPFEAAYEECLSRGIASQLCAVILDAEAVAQRPGVSVADFTDDAGGAIEIADFYFAPRFSVVANGQTVSFRNSNRPGGNPHSVSSGDWGGSEPVLPVPVLGFGAGEGFRSGKLGPGEPFEVTVDVATLEPETYLLLPNGDALIGFHCYIHGASQMNGVLLVRDVVG